MRYFRDRDKEAVEATQKLIADAHAIIAFANQPYFAVFMDWLESEAMKPFSDRDHSEMLKSVARANTLGEVRRHLKQRIAQANTVIEDSK